MHHIPYNVEEARLELQAILDSGLFSPSARQAKLLEYLFEKFTQGKEADLKEYTIAVELFEKPQDFDQHADATVRVEAHRLRKKLEKYYQTTGRDSRWRMTLPAGHYCLEFRPADLKEAHTQTGILLPGRRALLFSLLAGLALTTVLFFFYARAGRQSAAETPTVGTLPPPEITLVDPEPDAVRILAGCIDDYYQDGSGRLWQKDRFFEGGTIRPVTLERISRTGRPQLFGKAREGRFRYRIPLQCGDYELRLYFVDPDGPDVTRNPERRFRIIYVTANGQDLGTWNLVADSGEDADIRVFKKIRPGENGFLNLSFENTARSPAVVSAIEILPMIDGRVRPVRIVAQVQPYWDSRGAFWSPDDYYSGGSLGGHPAMISGGADPGIFSNERYGNFEYFIPVADGEYRVNLYFGESWFGPGQYGGGSVGSRVFNVLLNHEQVLSDMDMLREAPPLRSIVRSLRRVKPDPTGKIRLTFSSLVNHASVRAIEVLPE
jgi:hypothetical protein